MGQREHPLAYRNGREYGVHEVRGELRHAASATTGTEAASLAGERHEALEGTAVAPNAGEAATEGAAGQEAWELSLDELRQTASLGAQGDLGAKGLEVLADDPMEDGALHAAGLVARGARARRRSEPHAAAEAARKHAIPCGTGGRIATAPENTPFRAQAHRSSGTATGGGFAPHA